VQLAIQPINFYLGTLKRQNGVATATLQITLSCGCPTCAGGRFDPERFNVVARLFKKDTCKGEFRCVYSGQASQFVCHFPDVEPGRYHLEIEGSDPDSGAAGRLCMAVEVI